MKAGNPENNQAEVGMTVQEAGRRGGQSTLKRKGIEFYREIGRKGGQRTTEMYRDLLAEFGRKGGRPRRPNLEQPEGEHPERKEAGRPLGSSPPG